VRPANVTTAVGADSGERLLGHTSTPTDGHPLPSGQSTSATFVKRRNLDALIPRSVASTAKGFSFDYASVNAL
jgi:hypothetical protein